MLMPGQPCKGGADNPKMFQPLRGTLARRLLWVSRAGAIGRTRLPADDEGRCLGDGRDSLLVLIVALLVSIPSWIPSAR